MVPHGAVIDDASLGLADKGQECLNDRNLAEQIDFENLAKLVERRVFYRRRNPDPGIVEETIQSAAGEPFADVLSSPVDRLTIRNIKENGFELSCRARPKHLPIGLF